MSRQVRAARVVVAGEDPDTSVGELPVGLSMKYLSAAGLASTHENPPSVVVVDASSWVGVGVSGSENHRQPSQKFLKYVENTIFKL